MHALKDINVLVVDDDDMLRSSIAFFFKRKGFTTFEANNGRVAFEIVKKNKIDVVLSDVRMPGGDGIELLNQVKAHNAHLPVVLFITGFADMSLEDAYNQGADAVFAKPFDSKALLAAVFRAVSDKSEIWTPREHNRIPVSFEVQLSQENILSKVPNINGEVKNIGRGGFFVAMNEPFPNIKDIVRFQISLNLGDSTKTVKVEGAGIVRWVRHQQSNHFEKGCGIEFVELSDSCKAQILQFVQSAGKVPFIPKS